MPVPRFCPNPVCSNHRSPRRGWLIRNGNYPSQAHGRIQRYLCRACGKGFSDQTESIHYFAKRRVDLSRVFSRIRGGSSMRDIARELGFSRTTVANAVLRLGRQAMAAHLQVFTGLQSTSHVCFDGLLSALTSHDYPAQITTLADSQSELILAMTHCVTYRGGTLTAGQQRRRKRHRAVWAPPRRALTDSITLLVKELSRFASPHRLLIDTDEHPIYPRVIDDDIAMGWYRSTDRLHVRQTVSTAPRTIENPLFVMNYVDRMIRHRLKEHTRETIACARNATMQMHRMWIFTWDHNCCQPKRVKRPGDRCRAEYSGVPRRHIERTKRWFFTRRINLHGLSVPESMRLVWRARLETPPVRWKQQQKVFGPLIPKYALRDLSLAYPHGP